MEFLEQNWQTIIMLTGSAIAFLFRLPLSKWILKQNQADVKASHVNTDSNIINNLERSMNIYIAMIDDIGNKLIEKDIQIEMLIAESESQKKEIRLLIEEIRYLKIELDNYMR